MPKTPSNELVSYQQDSTNHLPLANQQDFNNTATLCHSEGCDDLHAILMSAAELSPIHQRSIHRPTALVTITTEEDDQDTDIEMFTATNSSRSNSASPFHFFQGITSQTNIINASCPIVEVDEKLLARLPHSKSSNW